MVRAFYSDGSTALYPLGTYKRAARETAQRILNGTNNTVGFATAGDTKIVAVAIVDGWDDDYVPRDADVFVHATRLDAADLWPHGRERKFAPAEALGAVLRAFGSRVWVPGSLAGFGRSEGGHWREADTASRLVPTGYGIDPDDGSTTFERAAQARETARRTIKVNPSKVPLTSPENAGERRKFGAWIAERAGDGYVTTTEAAHVVQWCREWIAELEDATPFEDGEQITDADALAFTQRYCEGGMRFVLDDVRRCRDTFAATAVLEAEARDNDMPSAEDIAEAAASLDGTPYTVAKTYNAGEDGMLWQVLRDGVPVPDAGGNYMRAGAVLEAADLATLDKLTDAEREAVTELRSRTPDGRYALAVLDAAGLVEIREADTDADPVEILSRARADYAGTLARVVDVNGSVSLVDADAEDAEIRRNEENRVRALVKRAEDGDRHATEALFELVRDGDEFAPFAQAEAKRQRRKRA